MIFTLYTNYKECSLTRPFKDIHFTVIMHNNYYYMHVFESMLFMTHALNAVLLYMYTIHICNVTQITTIADTFYNNYSYMYIQ